MILSVIKQAVCLTLDKRVTEFDRIQKEWARFNIPIQRFLVGSSNINESYNRIDDCEYPPIFSETIRYPTWLNRTSAYDAWKSHRQILENFVNNHYTGFLLMLEDDSFIESDFENITSKIYLQPSMFDMLYFGCYHYENSYVKTNIDSLHRLQGSGGWHGVMMSRDICKELLKYPPIGPYDWICGKYIHTNYRCYSIYPCVVSQKSGYSFVEGTTLDKPSRYKL